MNRILVDLAASSKQYLRSKVGAFFTFIFPILLILLFGAIFTSSSSTKVTIPIQNLDDGPYSLQFIEIMNSTGVVNVKEIPKDANLTDYISENSLSLAMQIPANFSDRLVAIMNMAEKGTANVTLYGDKSQASYGTAISVIQTVSDNMNYGLANMAPIVSMNPPQGIKERFTYMDFFLPGVIGMTVMTNSLFSMTSICATYRDRSYFKLLATTKLKKHEWLISRFLLYTILMYMSLFATFAVGKAVFSMHATLTPLTLALIPAGAFLFVSMGMLLGSALKDPESGVAVANAVGFPMMFLSGTFFQIEAFPSFMQTISKALPLTYLNNGLRDTMVYGNTASALINLAVVAVVGLVFAVLASKAMSWKEK